MKRNASDEFSTGVDNDVPLIVRNMMMKSFLSLDFFERLSLLLLWLVRCLFRRRRHHTAAIQEHRRAVERAKKRERSTD